MGRLDGRSCAQVGHPVMDRDRFAGSAAGIPASGSAVIVMGTFVLSIVFHILCAVAFSTPIMFSLYGTARHTIQATLGVCFAFAGFTLLTSRV